MNGIATAARIVGIIRDLVVIALLVTFIVVGAKWAVALHQLQQQPAIVQPTPPLPVDRCGGGIC